MPRPPTDEVTLAVNWFAFWRVEQEEQIGGKERLAELSRILGKTELSNIKRHQTGVGLKGILKVGGALSSSPGKFLDEALRWWVTTGREFRLKVLEQRMAEAAKGVKRARRPVKIAS